MTAETARDHSLPAGFEELERFVERFAQSDTNARIAARSEATMVQIRDFYDAMIPRAKEAIALVDAAGLRALPAEHGRLAQLVLALAHAATSIEVIGAPRVVQAPYPNSVRVARGSPPFG